MASTEGLLGRTTKHTTDCGICIAVLLKLLPVGLDRFGTDEHHAVDCFCSRRQIHGESEDDVSVPPLLLP